MSATVVALVVLVTVSVLGTVALPHIHETGLVGLSETVAGRIAITLLLPIWLLILLPKATVITPFAPTVIELT